MKHSVQKSLVTLGIVLGLSIPSAAFCDIWDLTKAAIARNKSKISHSQVISHLQLLTSDGNIRTEANATLIAGGYIVITRESIQSFKNPGDHSKGETPEFEFLFEKTDESEFAALLLSELPFALSEEETVTKKDLKGIHIALDIIPSHDFFKDPIGGWSYEKFVGQLQEKLGESLKASAAEVSILRPKVQFNAAFVDEVNKNPPDIVISTQFNNDKQDDMVTFCGGNISEKELSSDRQRARFISTLLTGKHICSAELGACITKQCQDQLGVKPLSWKKASFEGNARPAPVAIMTGSELELDTHEDNFNGIAMRNLMHNGIFAKAVVVPFPDMKWVRDHVVKDHEGEWITQYADAITRAVLSYVSTNSKAFE